MQGKHRFRLVPLKLALPLVLGLITATAAGVPAASAHSLFGHGFGFGFGRDADLSGDWLWEEHFLVVLPGDVAMQYFGIAESEGAIMIMRCRSWGDMMLTQTGDSFDGFANQSSACTTRGGQTAAHPPMPPGFGVTGTIDGRVVSFSADVGNDIDCSYRGVARTAFGLTFAVDAAGGCEVPAPFQPNISWSYSFDMRRP